MPYGDLWVDRWALYDCNALFEVAFDEIDKQGKVKRARINRLRTEFHDAES